DVVEHFAGNGGRATISFLENRAVLAAAPVYSIFGLCLAFCQTREWRKKSRIAFVSQKLALFLNQCAVAAAIRGVEPIDLRIGDRLRSFLGPLPRGVLFVAFARGFGVVACAVDRPRKCNDQRKDRHVPHPSIPPQCRHRAYPRKNHLPGSEASIPSSPAKCPDSEVRIIVLQPRLRTSESKDTCNLLVPIARPSAMAAGSYTGGDTATGRLRLLVLQPTPFCNIDCSYCYLSNRGSAARMSLAT